ncbi:MAG: molecular chaperone HtpG, partial [Anaerolineae bacterium]|nr:molecular chaperone HtpG [Anaerolineae bacterium]
MSESFQFKAEIKQLLDILVHSLYTEREIFLRELISNASDALSRVQFEQLTNHDLLDPEAELAIEIKPDEEAGTLTISDSGIGMNEQEMIENLGVIAHSGAKAFIEAMKQNGGNAQDVIGQFGVGFYSLFMVADKVRVVSRSYRPEEQAHAWVSDGGDTYTVEPAEREERGTDIILYLKDDAKEFLQEWKLKDVVRTHSDYVAFPIYVGDDEEPTNKQQAIWRQDPKEITDEQYNDFYKMFTMDFNEPLHHIHMRADVPLQFYALLYIPSSAEQTMFSLRKEPGLKLYARKVMIQEYSKDLLPEYLQFVQGVVDSEDLPLSVSRESVQANRVIVNLKKTLTSKVLSELKRMAKNKPEQYLEIFKTFSHMLKQGVVVSPEDKEDLQPLFYFSSTHDDDPETMINLDEYVERMASNQEDIYYIIGDDFHSARRSPHLGAFRQRGIEVLYFTQPIDSFMIMGLDEYKGHKLRSVDEADIDLSEIGELKESETPQQEPLQQDAFTTLRERFESILGERVHSIRESKSMTDSPARLVSDDKTPQRNMFRINRLLERDFELPVKTLELNPRHPLIHNLSNMVSSNAANPFIDVVIEQVFETALLQDGIHPDPAGMAPRLQMLMQAATGT